MKMVKLHEIIPTTDNGYKSHEIVVNFDRVLSFKTTLDGKYTSINFGPDGFIFVSEKFEDIVSGLDMV